MPSYSDFTGKFNPNGINGEVNFAISDIDSSSSPQYFGFLSRFGSWVIMKLTDEAVRYANGNIDYTTNWTNRASLDYGYFDQKFK